MSAVVTNRTSTDRPSRAERLLGLVRKLHRLRPRTRRHAAPARRRRPLVRCVQLRHPRHRADPRLHHPWPASSRALEARLVGSAARLDAEPRRRDQPAQRKPPAGQPAAAATARPTLVPLPCPSRSRLPPKSAAGRSASSSPISAAISVSSRATRYGGTSPSPSLQRAATSSPSSGTSATGSTRSSPRKRPPRPGMAGTIPGARLHRPTLKPPNCTVEQHTGPATWPAPPS